MSNKILKNTIYLYVLQGVNFFLPILIIPYLITEIGIENFGRISFATAIASILILITDFGFNYSGVRHVSVNNNDIVKRNQIFTSIIIVKVILLILSAFFLYLTTFAIEKFYIEKDLITINLFIVLGHILISAWFFQGIQEMQYIAYLNAISKAMATISIFVFVNKPEDMILVPVIYALFQMCVGIYAIYIIITRFNFIPKLSTRNELRNMLKESRDVFIMNLTSTIYTNLTLIIIGIFFSEATTGTYAAVDRLINAAKKIYMPLSQALYPVNAKIASKDKFVLAKEGKFKLAITLSIFVFITLIAFWAADLIVNFVITIEYLDDAAKLFKILIFVPIFTLVSNVFGMHVLFNIGEQKFVRNIILMFAVFYALLLPITVVYNSIIAVATLVVITELGISMLLFYRTMRIYK